jgi:hypothetical protein
MESTIEVRNATPEETARHLLNNYDTAQKRARGCYVGVSLEVGQLLQAAAQLADFIDTQNKRK